MPLSGKIIYFQIVVAEREGFELKRQAIDFLRFCSDPFSAIPRNVP
jgi:hypothetical protein